MVKRVLKFPWITHSLFEKDNHFNSYNQGDSIYLSRLNKQELYEALVKKIWSVEQLEKQII